MDVSDWNPGVYRGPGVARERASRLRAALAMLWRPQVFLITLVYRDHRLHGGAFLTRSAARRYVETWRPVGPGPSPIPSFHLTAWPLLRSPRPRPWSTS